jgi:hypothetical protein
VNARSLARVNNKRVVRVVCIVVLTAIVASLAVQLAAALD